MLDFNSEGIILKWWQMQYARESATLFSSEPSSFAKTMLRKLWTRFGTDKNWLQSFSWHPAEFEIICMIGFNDFAKLSEINLAIVLMKRFLRSVRNLGCMKILLCSLQKCVSLNRSKSDHMTISVNFFA